MAYGLLIHISETNGLKKLKEDDYVTTYLVESENGPARKYYKLTNMGKSYYEMLKKEWDTFVKAVEKLMKPEITLQKNE